MYGGVGRRRPHVIVVVVVHRCWIYVRQSIVGQWYGARHHDLLCRGPLLPFLQRSCVTSIQFHLHVAQQVCLFGEELLALVHRAGVELQA